MSSQKRKPPWWEMPAKAPGEPQYQRERERLRAELARARRAESWDRDPDRAWMRPRTPRAA